MDVMLPICNTVRVYILNKNMSTRSLIRVRVFVYNAIHTLKDYVYPKYTVMFLRGMSPLMCECLWLVIYINGSSQYIHRDYMADCFMSYRPTLVTKQTRILGRRFCAWWLLYHSDIPAGRLHKSLQICQCRQSCYGSSGELRYVPSLPTLTLVCQPQGPSSDPALGASWQGLARDREYARVFFFYLIICNVFLRSSQEYFTHIGGDRLSAGCYRTSSRRGSQHELDLNLQRSHWWDTPGTLCCDNTLSGGGLRVGAQRNVERIRLYVQALRLAHHARAREEVRQWLAKALWGTMNQVI